LSLLKRKAALPLETLFAAAPDSPHYRRGETMTLFYAQSWALTHYFQSDAHRRNALASYVTRLGAGGDPLDAARAVFGDLDALAADLRSYVRSRRFHGARLGRPLVAEDNVQVRSLSAPEVETARSTFH
jgi:hypothetical protein